MNRYCLKTGVIINLYLSGESDLVVTLLTDDSIKIKILAKGAKSLKSQRLRSLQLGNIVKTEIYSKNDYNWLSEITTVSQFLHNKKSLTQLNLLFYFLEILNHFTVFEQQSVGLYTVSSHIILAISENNLTALIKHEIELLSLLGFGVPKEILESYKQSDFINCQKYIRRFLESIIEKPLRSSKLFA